mmetsp:Transcript_22087/g.71472  ORF Transcript_22087/g.71472 Transcript_22087/m.71472 type:complete len:235 (+) Transcript_22087:1440-2144(+)
MGRRQRRPRGGGCGELRGCGCGCGYSTRHGGRGGGGGDRSSRTRPLWRRRRSGERSSFARRSCDDPLANPARTTTLARFSSPAQVSTAAVLGQVCARIVAIRRSTAPGGGQPRAVASNAGRDAAGGGCSVAAGALASARFVIRCSTRDGSRYKGGAEGIGSVDSPRGVACGVGGNRATHGTESRTASSRAGQANANANGAGAGAGAVAVARSSRRRRAAEAQSPVGAAAGAWRA